jgi:AAA domain
MELKKASRKKVKLRLGLSGASGFGKTYSALLLAYGMTNDWSKIAVIDTENGSAELYSNLGEYNVLNISAPFSPEKYIEAIRTCENADIEVIIIDSISHEWEGKGGCLDINNELGGRFTDWAKVTPRHTAFVQSLLQSKCHIITTVRRKQEYDMIKNEKGKIEPVKVGTKEVTKDGFEYELTINFEFINDKHMVRASKDRTSMFANKPEFVISSETGKQILEWCESGIDELKTAISELESCKTREEMDAIWKRYFVLQKEEKFIESAKKMAIKYPKTI